MFATRGYLLSATSHVKGRKTNSFSLMSATRGYLLSVTSHVNKKRSNGLGLLSATVQQAVDLLSATSYVTRRRNNGLGLLSVTRNCLLSATSHVNRKRKGYLQAIWFWSYLHFTWPSLSPTRTRPSEDVKVIKMGIARGPLKLCQNQKSFKTRFN